MLDSVTKNRINTARDILVGKVPDPKSQVEQITIALIYKFMDDMDVEAEELGGKRTFFSGEYAKYSWRKIFDPRQSGYELLNLYSEAITKMDTNPGVPKLFRDIFKNAYLPYRDPETLKSFLKIINEFEYTHSEKLGDAFEFLLSILGSQGDAGQFRTPRHIIDFMVAIIDPKKNEVILDPACGTAGFLISSYKHIIKQNSSNYIPEEAPKVISEGTQSVNEVILSTNGYSGDKLTADERRILADNMHGYDISPDMVRLSLVNMYLHGVKEPQIFEYDSLTSEDHWNEYSDVILANPPFMSPKGGIRPHKRFSVQSNRSEVLFVDYIAEHLTQDGRAAVIVPEGIIFQSGNAYKQLRKMLVDKYLVGVISLPAGVFNPYSGVKTSILWLDKTLAKKTDKILFVKIENDGFDLGAQRRAIKQNDLPYALQKIFEYKNQLLSWKLVDSELSTNISFVTKKDISYKGDYNLSGEKYKIHEKKTGKWDSVKIGEVATIINGRAYNQNELLDAGPVPVLRVGNFFSNRDWYYSDLELPNDKYCVEGDLLYAWSASFGPRIWKGPRAIYHYHIWKIVPSERINKVFLYYLLDWDTENMKSEGGRGIAMTHITKSGIEERKIPLPPLPIQEEIVAEVESYQKIIDGARQVVENYKPRIDIDPAWEMVELGKVCEITSSKRIFQEEYVNEGVPFYRTKEVVELSKGNPISLELFISKNRYEEVKSKFDIPMKGDILLSAVGTIGISWVVPDDREFYFKDGNLLWLKNIENALPDYIKVILDHVFISELDKLTYGAAYKALTIIKLKELKIPLPTIEIQKHIVSQLQLEQGLITSNNKLIELYQQKIKDRIAKVWGE
jgi:type I restriction enzyme M protein